MTFLRGAALAGIAGAVLASLTFGAAMPASAADSVTPLFPSASNAADYALTVRGMDIYAAQSDAARAAWSPQMARVAAKDANIYRAAQVYGTLDPEQLAEVIPMNKAVDGSLNGKLTKGMLVTNGPKGWVGKGFRFPSFSSAPWSGIRNVVGGVAAGVGMYAWDQRADIANGVASWVGVDATGAVCSDPVAGGHNPINWITGQNCDQWKAGIAFEANKGLTPGVTWGPSCSVAVPTNCVTFIAEGANVYSSGNQLLCFKANDSYAVDTFRVYLTGTFGGAPWEGSYRAGRNGGMGDWAQFCPTNSQTNAPVLPVGSDYKVSTYRVDEAGTQPVSPTNNDTDPERMIRCTQYGASGVVSNGYTAKFRQSSLVGKSSPQPVCTALPGSEAVVRLVVTQIDPDGETLLYDKSETPAATDFRSKYSASCGTAETQHSCLLDVVQIGNGISCFSATATCTDWFHDPARDSKYQCQFGGNNEPVQQCAILANTFDAAKRAAGNPYADPLTGDDLFSGTGADADTMTMGNPAGAAIQPNGEVGSCYGGNSPGAFNPISWILRGGQCLLNWAFVPRPLAVQAQMEKVASGWQDNSIAKLVTAVNGWHISPVVSGCSSNLAFPVPMIHQTISVPIIQACPGTPMGDFAPWVRGLVSAGLIVTAGFAVKRIVSGWLPS